MKPCSGPQPNRFRSVSHKNIYKAFLHCFYAVGHWYFKHLSITHIIVRVIIQTPHPGIRSLRGRFLNLSFKLNLRWFKNNCVFMMGSGPNEWHLLKVNQAKLNEQHFVKRGKRMICRRLFDCSILKCCELISAKKQQAEQIGFIRDVTIEKFTDIWL